MIYSASNLKKLAAICGIAAGALTYLPAWGAERIQFFIGPFEPTIYVDDLETFAETGEVVDRFGLIGDRLSDEQKTALQNFLNARYDLDVVSTAQFTYSPIGERLLQGAGQIVQTENFLSGMKPLRAALIAAAANGEGSEAEAPGFSPLDVIRQFPLETIQLDAGLMQEIIAENETIFRRRDVVTADIREIAEAQAALSSRPLPDPNPQEVGNYTWRIETIQFQNPARPASSLADVYYPEGLDSSASIPVVVISHGFASDRQTFDYLAQHFASHGYAVVAVEHIESNRQKLARFIDGLEGAPDPRNILYRPQDITSVLNTLENYQGDNLALNNLNLEAVGLVGQSLGGYTVLAAAGAAINREKILDYCNTSIEDRLRLNLSTLIQCRVAELPEEEPLEVADPRVAAVVAINPLTSQIFGESGLQQIQVPVMMVASTRDYFVPALPEQIEPFGWLTTEHKKLVLIEPGTHFSSLQASRDSVLPIPPGLIGADPQQSFPQIQALSLSFLNRHLKNKTDAELFLSQAYLNTFPESDFQFSLVDDYSIPTNP